ncbi:MAG: glycoside hydrolase family 28 protein [Rhodospirillales bacterium]|nr:glycoside hydrolase family 28 protein [Rhodospirillales bacterium]
MIFAHSVRRRELLRLAPGLVLFRGGAARADVFDVRDFGAVGDGTTIDTAAINQAIAAAVAAGGGTVLVPPGIYASYSIRLRSRIVLHLAPGATLLAATPGRGRGHGYDRTGAVGLWAAYQDFGHDHWHDSLIWGEGLHDVAIRGPGLIQGKGLSRGLGHEAGLPPTTAPGAGNKTIALRNCRNVTLRDLRILDGGHIGFLATGVDDLAVEDVTIDTDRDGMNIDCCRNVRISGCRVNSPWDDGIALKSSFALGEVRATENVVISDCMVTGRYRLGALADGSFRRFAGDGGPYGGRPVGRIKCGTESVGGFRNIAISNCIFEGCRGVAIECVDGGVTEDITIRGLVMRDIRNAPFFLRLGERMRGPAGRPVGRLRRVIISDVVCDAPANTMPAIISGIPGHPIEDVVLSNIRIVQKGGGSAAMANIVPPEERRRYPSPAAFGTLPAQGLFVRHARNVEIRDVGIASRAPDARPLVWLGNVDRADVEGLRLAGIAGAARAPVFLLNGVTDFRARACGGMRNEDLARVARRVLR